MVKVVARSVEVHGEKKNRIVTILLTIGLRLHQQHFLGQSIGRIRFLWVSVPERVLFEGYGYDLRVGAHGTDQNDFLDVSLPAFMDEMNTHRQVVVEEISGMSSVGSDASDSSGEMDDDIRGRVPEHGLDGISLA